MRHPGETVATVDHISCRLPPARPSLIPWLKQMLATLESHLRGAGIRLHASAAGRQGICDHVDLQPELGLTQPGMTVAFPFFSPVFFMAIPLNLTHGAFGSNRPSASAPAQGSDVAAAKSPFDRTNSVRSHLGGRAGCLLCATQGLDPPHDPPARGSTVGVV